MRYTMISNVAEQERFCIQLSIVMALCAYGRACPICFWGSARCRNSHKARQTGVLPYPLSRLGDGRV